MRQMLLAPIAPLFEFDFALHKLLVLLRPIVGAFALGTVEFYKAVLGHKCIYQSAAADELIRIRRGRRMATNKTMAIL